MLTPRVIASLPQSQQLTAAANAISQLAQIYASRAEWLIDSWKEAHTKKDTTLPILSSLDARCLGTAEHERRP